MTENLGAPEVISALETVNAPNHGILGHLWHGHFDAAEPQCLIA
jgi:hypothetical protein